MPARTMLPTFKIPSNIMLLHQRSTAFLATLLTLFVSFADSAFAQRTDTRPDVGISENRVNDYLIINARIVLEPGATLEKGMLWVEDGKVIQVGESIRPREGLRVIDLAGKTIYPGFVDAGLETDLPESASVQGTPHWNPEITPQRSVALATENLSNLDRKSTRLNSSHSSVSRMPSSA